MVSLLRSLVDEVREFGRVESVFTRAADHGEPLSDGTEHGHLDYPHRVLARMRDLGLYYPSAPPEPDRRKGRARDVFLTSLARQVQLIVEAAGWLGVELDLDRFGLELSALIGAHLGLMPEALHLRELSDRDEPSSKKVIAAQRTSTKAVGRALKRTLLTDDHPLLEGTFHRLLIVCATRLLLDLARLHFLEGEQWETEALRLVGESDVQRTLFVEAIIGVSWADGRMAPVEDRFIKELLKVACFSPDEVRALRHCAKHEAPSPTELAEGITDPISRSFVIELVTLTSLVDGEMAEAEEAYIEELSEAFGLDRDHRVGVQLETVAFYERHPELLKGLSLRGLVGRVRRRTQLQVETIVRENLKAVLVEAKETGDLLQLMAASTHRPLTNEEAQRVVAQLLDIARTIPSLALLAAPGGTILVPIMLRVLPFNLLPSAFIQKDETF